MNTSSGRPRPEPALRRLLRERARAVARVRQFFDERGVLEVDTPLLAEQVIVEAHIDPIACTVDGGEGPRPRYLLTSPEAPMKRLLAAGSGSIYQFAHAFRDGEVGRRHAVEFSMLEWYRPGLDHAQLMDEVEALVSSMLPGVGGVAFERWTYRDLFLDRLDLDPFDVSMADCLEACARNGVPVPADAGSGSIDDVLDLLLVACIEPTLGGGSDGSGAPAFVTEYPASQAALARTRTDGGGRIVGERFELYVRGVELANGYHELSDAVEQRARFEAANARRIELGRAELPLDEKLLAALPDLPPCAGVALGFDRLLMLVLGAASLADVQALGGAGSAGVAGHD